MLRFENKQRMQTMSSKMQRFQTTLGCREVLHRNTELNAVAMETKLIARASVTSKLRCSYLCHFNKHFARLGTLVKHTHKAMHNYLL